MTNLIKWFSFSKELSGGSRSALVVVLSIAPLGWFPTVEGLYFLKTVWDGMFFVIVYSLITWMLYLFVRNRIVSKHVTMDTLATILCAPIDDTKRDYNLFVFIPDICIKK